MPVNSVSQVKSKHCKSMIEVKNLTFRYKKSNSDVFKNLNLTLSDGHIYGLLGKNGAGKSTLLYLMAGLLRPTEGEVSYNSIATFHRQQHVLGDMFLLPDEFSLPGVTMQRFEQLYAPFYPKFDHEVLQQCLDEFSLSSNVQVNSLSLGERKKSYISFAIATRVGLLLMDEPTNGLDIPSKSIFRKMLARHIMEGQTVIISTHQVHDVSTLFDEVLVLQDGGRLVDKPLDDVAATTENIEELFVELTKEEKEAKG